ncbi:MAG: hypothetical protein ACE5EV_04430 [Gaiellales bacterium]
MTAILGFADELVEGGDLTQIPPERLAAVNAIATVNTCSRSSTTCSTSRRSWRGS